MRTINRAMARARARIKCSSQRARWGEVRYASACWYDKSYLPASHALHMLLESENSPAGQHVALFAQILLE